jgi:hypothetical protein
MQFQFFRILSAFDDTTVKFDKFNLRRAFTDLKMSQIPLTVQLI